MRRDAARRDFFLGNDRDARRRLGQRIQNDLLGSAVADGDGRLVALGFDLETLGDQLEDFRPGVACGDAQGFEEIMFVHYLIRSYRAQAKPKSRCVCADAPRLRSGRTEVGG
jgi:hypothetical protein